MQGQQSTKQPQVFEIGNMQTEDWCKLEVDFLQHISYTNPLSRFYKQVGVTASMFVLEPDEEGDTLVSCAAVNVSEDYKAMMDSGTNAIIDPLHPCMCGEIAECRVPSSMVQGPIVQVLDYRGSPINHSFFTSG